MRSGDRSRARSARQAAGTRGRALRPAAGKPAPSGQPAIVRPNERCRARSQPELRTAQRLQPAACLPARVRRKGRSDRIRPPGDPDAAVRIPRAFRHPPPASHPPTPSAGQAVATRSVRAGPPYLPVLRSPGARHDARSRRPAASRRRTHLGEPRDCVQALQPPKGRQDARRGAVASPPAAVRAAQRHLLVVHAVPRRRSQRGVAVVPVPGSQLTAAIGRPEAIEATIPPAVRALLESLWTNGHAAYVVGGSLRDVVIGRRPADWDLASDALPEAVVEMFPDAVYENKFGTVAVRRDGETFEITTFRIDHDYADFRRPHRVEFGDTIDLDLARRDFTVNAMAWGARPGEATEFLDPYGGLADAEAALLRAVGEPRARFEEDALRMVRAVRLAATLGFGVEPATLAGIQARAELVAHLSGERIATELHKMLAAPVPSVGLRLMSDTDLLAPISPDLAAQRGVPQNKIPGEDLWDHTLRSVDAAPASRPVVRLAALLHDIGKPTTYADGHFIGHDVVGARLADAFLDRLREPRSERDRIVELVRLHMFSYESSWSDAAVRRFIGRLRKIGPDALEELLALREADNVGSGLPAEAGRLDELRARVAAERAAGVVLDRTRLAIDGTDLIAELDLSEGPMLGRILDHLLEAVIADPTLNRRSTLLALARDI